MHSNVYQLSWRSNFGGQMAANCDDETPFDNVNSPIIFSAYTTSTHLHEDSKTSTLQLAVSTNYELPLLSQL